MKPDVLSDEELEKIFDMACPYGNQNCLNGIRLMQLQLTEVQRDADVAYYECIIKETKKVLEAARAAILDAIYCEDGLDGHTGSVVMEWITDILGDEKEYRPTIEGISSQTQISEDKAFLHRDNLIQQAKAEVAREIFEEIESTFGWLTGGEKWQIFQQKCI